MDTRRIICLALSPVFMLAAASQAAEQNLIDLDLATLMNMDITVTSVSKKDTQLFMSPAAIAVIGSEDVRRLGVATLPEALRWAPGMNVARINANTWAISPRGFNLQFAYKLLVLIDGRSVYTPTFGGVYWNEQDMALEDMERIEVIRGPGATLWGANAVNGVINISSKNSKDTQGTLIATSLGTEDRPSITMRHGGEISSDLHYRGYVKYFEREGLIDSSGADTADGWDSIRTGFRSDWAPSTDDLVTLQGDYYSAHVGQSQEEVPLTPPFRRTVNIDTMSRGGNILGRWTRTSSDASHWSLQAYLDHFDNFKEERRTADIQLEHRLPLGRRHDVVWGIGYRLTTDDLVSTQNLFYSPASRDLNLYTAFVQDQIALVENRWWFTPGVKVEHNDLTGIEIQPSARLLWTPTSRQTVWASASRAVSTPPRFYRDAQFIIGASQPPFSPVIAVAFDANPNLDSEVQNAFELGYRIKPAASLSLDFAAFYNVYDRVTEPVLGIPRFEFTPPPPHVLVPLEWRNSREGESYGGEVSVRWQPLERWQLGANYSWLHVQLGLNDALATGSPQQQASLRSYLTLPREFEINGAISFIDGVRPLDITGGPAAIPIPSYVRFDLGLVWRPRKEIEAGIWGQNLLDSRHPEFTAQDTRVLTEVPRTIYAKTVWRF